MRKGSRQHLQGINRPIVTGRQKGARPYRDSVIGSQHGRVPWEDEVSLLEGEVSDDDLVEEGDVTTRGLAWA